MTETRPDTAAAATPATDVGSVFVSNYPPYSFWSAERTPEALAALREPPERDATLGLYLHIPFCRRRCKFCYFKVYTDKDSEQVKSYLSALAEEVRLLSALPAVSGRPLQFIYFGGGTPSFISSRQLRSLVTRLRDAIPWPDDAEKTFECEPGTLTRAKLQAIRDIGVTRLSLGVEHFDDRILAENGRAHLSKEIDRVIPWIRELEFDQLNIDLITGMIGETWETWREAVRRAIDLDPDSVTIYQMELPYNTVYSHRLMDGTMTQPIADWPEKRAWHDYAIEEMTAAGFEIGSAYTLVKKGKPCGFVYRDAVWHGTDMIGAGVASFSHMSGVHYQNVAGWGDYLEQVQAGRLPLDRAFRTSPRERMTREMILQLKLGAVDPGYFRAKFGADIIADFRPVLETLQESGMLRIGSGRIELTRKGLLQVDSLLPGFYAREYQNARYT